MNYQDNEQLEDGQGSTQQNQNPTGQPLSGDHGGALHENSDEQEDWSEEEAMGDEEENIESGVVEEDEGVEGDADHYDKDEVGDSSYDRDETRTTPGEDDEEVRNQTMI